MPRVPVCLVWLVVAACSTDEADLGDKDTPAAGDEEPAVRAGFAVRDVSPTGAEVASEQVYMGAYGFLTQRGAATGVHDPIHARTLVIEAGASSVSMTILDLPGMSNRVIRDIVARASADTGMDPETIYVGSTHTHSAPDLQGLWGGVPAEYRQRVIDLTIASIVEAHGALRDAELFVSTGTGPNRNRRGWEMTDDALTVLEARTPGGDPIATLVQFAAHPVKLGAINHLISRDYVGYTVDRLEEALGGPVLYFNGIVGDCSPNGGESEPGCDIFECEFQQAESYGMLVADAALDVLETEPTRLSAGVATSYESWDQVIGNAGFIGLHEAGHLDYETISIGEGAGVRTQGAYFRLGTELQGVAFPGEALTRTGLAIKEQMKAPHRLFLGLTTDSLGYFVREDEWGSGRNGGYEETVSTDETAGERSIEVIGGLVTADNQSF
jgi:hypothetical protein